MTKVNQLDFTGTTIFCGLDVHRLSWRVNIRDVDLELKDFTQPANAPLLQYSVKPIAHAWICTKAENFSVKPQ